MNSGLYNELKARLYAKLGDKIKGTGTLAFVGMWNEILEELLRDDKGEGYYFDFPAAFFAFRTPNEVQSIGNNVQIFDPLEIEVHILHAELDGGEGGGELDTNLAVLDFKQDIYKALSLFRPTNTSNLVRASETQDTNHPQIYHYVQTYRCTFTDYSAQGAGGDGARIFKDPPTNFEDNITILTRP